MDGNFTLSFTESKTHVMHFRNDLFDVKIIIREWYVNWDTVKVYSTVAMKERCVKISLKIFDSMFEKRHRMVSNQWLKWLSHYETKAVQKILSYDND